MNGVRFQYWLAAGLWLAATLYTWPLALSFADEVGYVGNARLLASGRTRPAADDPGVWLSVGEARIAKYPYAHSLLLLPLVQTQPGAIFALGVFALLALAELVRRELRRLGHDGRWALLLLAHPTFVLLARTVMVDVLLSFLALACWRSLRERRPLQCALAFAVICLLKPTGLAIAPALLLGESLQRRSSDAPAGRSASQASPRHRSLVVACAGCAVGTLVAVGLNVLANGTIMYGHVFATTEPFFALEHLATSGRAHAISLLSCPPLLVLGAWPFLRERDLGPLFVVGGLTLAMALYFFVDRGRGLLDSVVLSQRLILPAVAFLMLGYARVLAELSARSRRLRRAVWALVALPACSALAIGLAHRRWQAPAAEALRDARAQMQRVGATELGTLGADKAALLFAGPVVGGVRASAHPPRVVLCAVGQSYRLPSTLPPCALAGYQRVQTHGRYGVLVAEE